jgi:hypothetical protein
MTKEKNLKKLSLNKETLRSLQSKELQAVAGGGPSDTHCMSCRALTCIPTCV